MTGIRSNDYHIGLVRELCKLPIETEWVEFKVNNQASHEIGEYISALANAAALNGKANGYMIWGVDDGTHSIVGSNFFPSTTKKGNEPLETWLLRLLKPKIHFTFFELTIEDKSVVLLEVGRAFRHPVRFQSDAYIRVGQVKKPLKDSPERELALWRILDQTPFENLLAVEHVSSDDVLHSLDYKAYFDLLEQSEPKSHDVILDALKQDNLIRICDAGGWDITNLGAILFARKLEDFPPLKRKAVRVIQYPGTGRTEAVQEIEGIKGYASGFKGLIGYIHGLLPVNEVIEKAFRKSVLLFPELAVRELVANALIHQDFFITGAGPMIEIFRDRIEITNPGEPLVDPQRFVDTPPRSRNEALASMMRRFRICEERGSGIDKVVAQVEMYQLPAPLFEAPEGFTRTVLFVHKPLTAMDRSDRIRACYLHACLKYVTRDFLTNTSLRNRFGIEEHNRSTVSRLIREAMDAEAIVCYDSDTAPKLRKYVPWWAAPQNNRKGE